MESKETDKRRTCQSLFLYVKKTRESNSLYKKRMICSRHKTEFPPQGPGVCVKRITGLLLLHERKMAENGERNNTLDSAHLMYIDYFIRLRIVKIDLKAFDKHKEKRYSSLEDIKGVTVCTR